MFQCAMNVVLAGSYLVPSRFPFGEGSFPSGSAFTCFYEHEGHLLDGLDLTQDNSHVDKYVSFGSLVVWAVCR